jgi:hypothetical protein
MWRILLSLIVHRFLLLVIALSAICVQIPSQDKNISSCWGPFLEKVAQSKEVQELKRISQEPFFEVIKKVNDPFLWLGRLFSNWLSLPPEIILLILSNLFLILFLRELNSLVNSMALPDVAVDTCVLVILWLTSYELSLGSSLSLSCFLCALVLRGANDSRWFTCGLAIGFLALTKPFALFLLIPVFLNLSTHFKYISPGEFTQKALLVLAPLGASVLFHRELYSSVSELLSHSAFSDLSALTQTTADSSWVFSNTFLGQTIALLILFIGTVICFFVFSTFIHRLLPLSLFIALVMTTPYRELATSALLVAPAFSGIAEASAPALLRTIQIVFLLFGSIEVFNLF